MDSTTTNFHKLSDKWTFWAHLPHNTDWTLNGYIPITTVSTIEETVMINETLPSILFENCMLFLMRHNIKPLWEDPYNVNGGYFSYKVSNKNVYKVWKDLVYVVVGQTISKQTSFVNSIAGITISPKKNFCIIKIWTMNCNFQNPSIITNEIKGLISQGCIFKKHANNLLNILI